MRNQRVAEVDRRRLYAKLGYSSMFTFCVERFRMSEPTAVKRIRAARAAQRFPVLLGMIARGEIHLSGLLRLSAHLTPENHVDVLGEAKHETLKEIDAIVARLAPKPDVSSSRSSCSLRRLRRHAARAQRPRRQDRGPPSRHLRPRPLTLGPGPSVSGPPARPTRRLSRRASARGSASAECWRAWSMATRSS